jgi:hypothetical protein
MAISDFKTQIFDDTSNPQMTTSHVIISCADNATMMPMLSSGDAALDYFNLLFSFVLLFAVVSDCCHLMLHTGSSPAHHGLSSSQTAVKGLSHEIWVSLLLTFARYEVRNRAGSGLFFNFKDVFISTGTF